MLTFLLEIKIGVAVGTGNTVKHPKMAAFNEEFLSENDFEPVLATFCCMNMVMSIVMTC